ncbi:hypothetical protein A3K29_02270 [Candidatus Collierbacteria bacterium RIFOXYB2_FULL_46_14]|uniref:Aspartate racemase n=1 Tax=Candidatus Collierbacteria bacterium GW2011_GWA2_46_26 TaxID=1618381 RepID=A0A0G1PI96_9BACT|nr:MAG: Aspartate racemase [Candidatus Collierbacteria bacterium GW2011_GWC2_44_13]KKU32524.1 MAG: Aspartate racemase [Candidatus Collierbacteria bacterium GW2011_GWA2_46_26]OGD72949.1 MAG: hypothetical protein A3K29_02270 [Candidatus Collierbacteria bacterium RIFOXYB2_FULL_46_14]OGD75991.1 MAG: hypothetical protein A3K43_02270 [Candidatus Collierbacteria bacterium RIFOXYA2_FULL_46_20]OGD77327.1 MAG: hypothetical protein A3K39_02270 [Candidatus Collierbacteria bacterium RIFOXYC2_FULL_43_15]OGD
MVKHKTIGVLGGSGPIAGANVYIRMLRHAQLKYHAVQDTDYPPTILYSLPLEGFTEKGSVDNHLLRVQFRHGLSVLQNSGSDIIIIACNTLHTLLPEFKDEISIPILDMISLTVDSVVDSHVRTVGVLASEESHRKQLYGQLLSTKDIEVLEVDDMAQIDLNNIILHVMGGTYSVLDNQVLMKVINSLVARGAESVIIGCTELSIVAEHIKPSIKLHDSADILAVAVVDYAMK